MNIGTVMMLPRDVDVRCSVRIVSFCVVSNSDRIQSMRSHTKKVPITKLASASSGLKDVRNGFYEEVGETLRLIRIDSDRREHLLWL